DMPWGARCSPSTPSTPGWAIACCSCRRAERRSRPSTAAPRRWTRRWWGSSIPSASWIDAMDDERIRQLTEEVLADLSRPGETDAPGVADLEARVAALEATVHDLRGGRRLAHPSLTILDLPSGSP